MVFQTGVCQDFINKYPQGAFEEQTVMDSEDKRPGQQTQVKGAQEDACVRMCTQPVPALFCPDLHLLTINGEEIPQCQRAE